MTQPPDDAALVARLHEEAQQLQSMAWSRADGGQDCSISASLAEEAATALEAKDRRIAELAALLEDCADELEAEVQGRYQGIGDHPAMAPKLARDLSTVVAARAALEPSDKGVG